MADLFRTCKDGHRCENNALCVESNREEGSYFCDCSTATGDVAGLSCEFQAENYCQAPQETTSSWFCTNQGTCVRSSSAWSCDCPTEYDGPHCEYIAGAKPSDWPGINGIQKDSSNSNSDDGLEIGVMISIIVVSAVVGLMLGYMVMRGVRRRRSGVDVGDELKEPSFRKAGQNAPKDQSEALNIEMDGTGFRDAVISSGTSNGTQPFTFDSGLEVDSEIGSPRLANPNTSATNNSYAPKANGSSSRSSNGNGNGHGMML